jgi:hypothetical protein
MIDKAVNIEKAVRFKHPLQKDEFKWREDIEYYLLVRHPFDVVVSYYYQRVSYHMYRKTRGDPPEMSEFIREGLPWILRRGRELHRELKQGRFRLWIRYEDLVVDTPGTLTRVLDALGMPYDLEVGLAAGQWDVLRANEGIMPEQERKFRKGKIGGYRDLPEDDIAFMRAELAKHDPKEQWGYVG